MIGKTENLRPEKSFDNKRLVLFFLTLLTFVILFGRSIYYEIFTLHYISLVQEKELDPQRKEQAYLWLLHNNFKALASELLANPTTHMELVTGSYIRQNAKHMPITIAIRGKGVSMKSLYFIDRKCIENESFARHIGVTMAGLIKKSKLDVIKCMVCNLLEIRNRGIRRASWIWLTEHYDFPSNFEWNAPNREEEMALPRRKVSSMTIQQENIAKKWLSGLSLEASTSKPNGK